MFRLLSILLVAFAVCALSAPAPVNYPTEEQSKAELKAAGMTQASIDGLDAFTKRFVSGFPLVQSNKEATDKFLAEYTTDVQNFVKAMSPEDQTIYNNYLKKYGLA
ncbi:hypothetical protein CRE_08905 [Caenorhabditis remanei]|uniref:SXP/RAL-2 family protein Ani s 5-like cation-binding domain-containing protein n=1 Tax=Caenorhabditis remanei TaxID=31234 RepID=E3LI85_CAERE|nr:hypothetical protein CRE_08905 [Caenorhabditis remanei]